MKRKKVHVGQGQKITPDALALVACTSLYLLVSKSLMFIYVTGLLKNNEAAWIRICYIYIYMR